jgi:RNA polymerase sigma-70 factor (ECF subfamily)
MEYPPFFVGGRSFMVLDSAVSSKALTVPRRTTLLTVPKNSKNLGSGMKQAHHCGALPMQAVREREAREPRELICASCVFVVTIEMNSEMPTDVSARKWFEEAVAAVLDNLYGAALRLTKNPADAEDLVGETVARAFESLHDIRSFRGWIFRILTNCFISECRKRKTRAETPLDGGIEDKGDAEFWLFDRLHQPFLLWWGNPEQQFLDNMLRSDLVRAVDELPETFRIVLVLAEQEGFDYQAIAGMLEIPVGTVRSRLSRARSMLQKSLWQHASDRGIATPEKSATKGPGKI